VLLAPEHLAGVEVNAAQLGVALVAPAAAVQIPLIVDRCHPVTLHALVVALLVLVAPEHLGAARLDLQQRGAGTVCLGDKDPVADNDRIAGVDALDGTSAPGEVKLLLAGGGVEGNQPAAGKYKAPVLLADCGQHRAGVTGQFPGSAPLLLAGALVEGDDTGAVALESGEVDLVTAGRAAADLHDQQVSLDDRGAADAEEVLHHPVVLPRVHLPERLAAGGAQAVQHSPPALKVDALAIHGRA